MPESLQRQQVDEDLLARIAMRVATARKAANLPRRVLSEMSGVSPRYLALLEAGEGNISVRLLSRVAAALGLQVGQLIAEDAPLDPDALRIAQLYRDAVPEVQAEARALLAPQNPAVLRAERVCLIGLRGAGKSTLGQMASDALGVPFVELGREIEAETDTPLAEVMALYGVEGYRQMEAEALERVRVRHDRVILAVAGGIVAEASTYERLLQQFHTVWIKTSPPEHMQRVRAQGDVRPMQGNPAAMSQLNALLEARTPLYERAEAQVDTSGRTPGSSLNDLLGLIAGHGFLSQS